MMARSKKKRKPRTLAKTKCRKCGREMTYLPESIVSKPEQCSVCTAEMMDPLGILPKFVGQCGLPCLWHEGNCRDQREEECAARAAEIMDPEPDKAKPKADCKKCSGTGAVASLDYPGKTVPCSECFSAPTFIGKLFDEMVKDTKERDADGEEEI